MYYCYILRSNKDRKLYIGYSSDLKKRLKEHNAGVVVSTKTRTPLELIFYEAFKDQADAKHREVFLKSGWGFRSIKKLIPRTIDK